MQFPPFLGKKYTKVLLFGHFMAFLTIFHTFHFWGTIGGQNAYFYPFFHKMGDIWGT